MALTKRELLQVLNRIRTLPVNIYQFSQLNAANISVPVDFVTRQQVQELKDMAERALQGDTGEPT